MYIHEWVYVCTCTCVHKSVHERSRVYMNEYVVTSEHTCHQLPIPNKACLHLGSTRYSWPPSRGPPGWSWGAEILDATPWWCGPEKHLQTDYYPSDWGRSSSRSGCGPQTLEHSPTFFPSPIIWWACHLKWNRGMVKPCQLPKLEDVHTLHSTKKKALGMQTCACLWRTNKNKVDNK